ncbi:MAG TPA: histidine phosphatase family protein [Myxococcota bacterium]|nr:histidine phosphatase family protein [Myxococcota bacterium]HNH49019.1 histidine phosphatase family protein [Myxococcota bacterium]
MKLLLVRHGQTRFNLERRFLGRTDLELDEEGCRQASLLAEVYRGQGRVYSSPLRRAMQTAAGLGSPIAVPGLMEMDMGELEGLSREEMEDRFPGLLSTWFDDPTHFRPPGGETLAETQERGWQALQEILEDGSEEVKVVVTHQLLLAGVLCRLSDVPLSKFRKFSHGNTGVTTLERGPAGLRIARLNDLAHLPPAP